MDFNILFGIGSENGEYYKLFRSIINNYKEKGKTYNVGNSIFSIIFEK